MLTLETEGAKTCAALVIWTGKYRDNRWRGTLLPTPTGKVLIGLRKLVREGIDGYLGSGKAPCKLASHPLRLRSALAQRSIKTNSPSLSAIAREGEGRRGGKGRGKGKTEGERGEKKKKKNDLANFFYKGSGTQPVLKRHPTFRPFTRLLKGSKVAYASNHYLSEIVGQTCLVPVASIFLQSSSRSIYVYKQNVSSTKDHFLPFFAIHPFRSITFGAR